MVIFTLCVVEKSTDMGESTLISTPVATFYLSRECAIIESEDRQLMECLESMFEKSIGLILPATGFIPKEHPEYRPETVVWPGDRDYAEALAHNLPHSSLRSMFPKAHGFSLLPLELRR